MEKEDYKLYGKFCAWTIQQGCHSPSFFAPPVVDFILYGTLDKVECKPEFISDPSISNLLVCLERQEEEKAFADDFEKNIDIYFDAGFTKSKVSMQDKESLIKCLMIKQTIGNSMMAINQFLDGLN